MATSARAVEVTRLSSIHPYPAMIANSLAMQLAKKHARPGRQFLDPFCGTGRTLMAATQCGMCAVGLDVNPLAVLIARAKAARVDVKELARLLENCTGGREREPKRLDLEPNRKVTWLSPPAQRELLQIIHWMNSTKMSQSARLILAALLSATTREVSYCRKGQWKLHRMSLPERRRYRPMVWDVFVRRLSRVIVEVEKESDVNPSPHIVLGDCTALSKVSGMRRKQPFDLVITSPPYGDSRTTVSYGDVSSLCLGVLQHVRGINAPHISSRTLDNACLGGQTVGDPRPTCDVRRYWAGGRNNEARSRVERFLADLGACCRELNAVLSQRADVIFIVSRRSAGGRRLYIDEFLGDVLSECGFTLEASETRTIVGKMTPSVVNARGASHDTMRVNTMRQELVLSFARR